MNIKSIFAPKKKNTEKETINSMACLMSQKGVKEFNKRRNEPYGEENSDDQNNMILSKEIRLGYNSQKTRRNNNIIVFGASGSGKTRSFIEPNILQYNTNFIIQDPGGELLHKYHTELEEHGYQVKALNFLEPQSSNHYNPFRYIREEKDIKVIIDAIFEITNRQNGHKDARMDDLEKLLISAIMLLVYRTFPKNRQNFNSVIKVLSEPDKIDSLFREYRAQNEKALAITLYDSFKKSSKKDKDMIILSAHTRLNVFELRDVKHITENDNLRLNTFADTKQALFVVTTNADNTFDRIVQMLYFQLFTILYKKNETTNKSHKGNQHTKFYMTPDINLSALPNFDVYIATIRTHDISIAMIAKSLPQLKSVYRKNTIIENCDSILYMGGEDKETIDWLITRQNLAHQNIKTISKAKKMLLSLQIMTPDKLACISLNDCYIQIRGERPYLGPKYDLTEHPNVEKN